MGKKMRVIWVLAALALLPCTAGGEVIPEPGNRVVVIIDGSGSYRNRRAEALGKTTQLLEAMAREKRYRWDPDADVVSLISLDAMPEILWQESLSALKKLDLKALAGRFDARGDLAGCTDVEEAFHQASRCLDGDPRYTGKFLFVFSDLLHEPPTSSINACAPPTAGPTEGFPWEHLQGVSVSLFWVPANHKLIWRKAVREHGLEGTFKIYTDAESARVVISPPPKPEVKVSDEDREKQRARYVSAGLSLAKWALGGFLAILGFASLIVVVACWKRRSSLRNRSGKRPFPAAGNPLGSPGMPRRIPVPGNTDNPLK